MQQLTVCILNWRRPANLPRVIASLRAQSIRPRIFVWNNSGEPIDVDCDWKIDSTINRQCIARWEMLAMADTPAVASLDDDLAIVDQGLLARAFDFLASAGRDTAIGPFGVTLPEDLDYAGRSDFAAPPSGSRDVDLIKGRHLMLRREDLMNNLRLTEPRFAGEWLTRRTEDDILLCGQLAMGRRQRHRLPAVYHPSNFLELPAPDALNARPDHVQRRTAACRAMFRR